MHTKYLNLSILKNKQMNKEFHYQNLKVNVIISMNKIIVVRIEHRKNIYD